jgi:acetoin utilization deacetylase AcuC-like enzyme
VSAMLIVEQRGGCDAQPWIRDEHGEWIPGHDGERRLQEVRAGLLRHAQVRSAWARVSDERLNRAVRALHEREYLCALARAPSSESVLMPEFAAPGMAPDTPVSADIAAVAYEGVRTAIAAAKLVADGARYAYALCRPPGHHAGPGWLGGYCYLNNAAAAAHTLQERGRGPVAILDLDIHYPNGTAAIVARAKDTTLHSLHAWPVVNIASPSAQPCCEREQVVEFRSPPEEDLYLDTVASSIEELATDADALVLSLGYDTVAGDPHGCWELSPEVFTGIGRLLAQCGLPVCVVQEGGYALDTLAACSYAFAEGLLGAAQAPDRPLGVEVGVAENIGGVR